MIRPFFAIFIFAVLMLATVAGADTPSIWTVDLGRGPVDVHVPRGYDGNSAAPLLIGLHGYQNNGDEFEDDWQMASVADAHGVFYATPTATTDLLGLEFWNATDACCDFFGANPDDSGYLRDLIEAIRDEFTIDDRRVYFAGFSNGGFMAYRMACEHADIVAAIVSQAGATFDDLSDCTPFEPVSVLQVHGTADSVINYNGGSLGGVSFPSAVESVQTWATYDGCDPVMSTGPNVDVWTGSPGAEATVMIYDTNCEFGTEIQLWTVPGAPHSMSLSSGFSTLAMNFLLDHPKPIACAGDVDRNGTVNTVDLLALLAEWGACDRCTADTNDDGMVDITDLLALLATWGPCE